MPFLLPIGQGLDAQVNQLVADAMVFAIDWLLQRIEFSEEYSFHVIPGRDWTRVKGEVSLSIRDSLRRDIVQIVGSYIRENERLKNLAYSQQGGQQLVGLLLDRIVSRLPGVLGRDDWRSLLGGAIQQILPWLDGGAFGEWITFAFMLEEMSSRFGDEDVDEKFYQVHLAFWPTLMVLETRPEMTGLLARSVTSFYDEIREHENGLWAWLARDDRKVSELLQSFENGHYETMNYMWERSRVEHERRTGAKDEWARLDYLVLQAARRAGPPESLDEILAGWGRHWAAVRAPFIAELSDAAETIARQAKRAWDDLRSNPAAFARRLVREFGASLSDVVTVLSTDLKLDLVSVARVLKNEFGSSSLRIAQELRSQLGVSAVGVARTLWSLGGNTRAQIAFTLWTMGRNSYVDVLRAVKSGTNASLATTTSAFYRGVTSNLRVVAKALWDMGGNNRTEIAIALRGVASSQQIADALWNGIGGRLSQVALALYNGVTNDLGRVASALYDGAVSNLASVAGALWHMGGNNRSEIASALWRMGGNTRTDIAVAIWNGVGGRLSSVANALYHGVSNDIHLVANALWHMGGNTRIQVAVALRIGVGGPLRNIATALYYGISRDLHLVANALWFMGENTRTDIARALWGGVGGISLTDVTTALWDGVGGRASWVAYALWHGIAGLNLGNVVHALMHSSINLSEWDAWAIANSL